MASPVFAEEMPKVDYVEEKDFPDSIPLLKKHENILILRTFSKTEGLAGLLFLLFACVFHLYGVAFIVGFIAASPYFWFRARKAGFVILAIILVVLAAKIWF